MKSIIADVQDQAVQAIEDGVTDSAGDQHMRVELIHSEDEFRLAEYIADNERRIGRIPHAFVYAGSVVFESADSTRRFATVQIPLRVFVATRDKSASDQEIQHRKASKWCVYVAAALAGQPVRSIGTNTAYFEEPSVEPISNTERSSMWEVRLTTEINMDTDLILSELDNE
jgi:hypothetical protein